MKLNGKFKIDFIGVERIKYEIDGREIEGREIAYRVDQKYGNLKASKEAVDALEAEHIKPFTPIEVTITIDTEAINSRNYRVTGVSIDGRKISAPASATSGSDPVTAPGSEPPRAKK